MAAESVSGLENVPPFGTPVIFAGQSSVSHRSFECRELLIPYPIFYFAKEELFRVPLLGWYIRRVNSFPVRRKEHDVGALKTALEVLKHGGGLMLFPEGGRRLDPAHQWKAKAGVGMLACMTGARVIPVGNKNAERFLSSFPQLGSRIWETDLFPPKNADHEAYQRFADEVMTRIKELCQ